MSYATPMLTAEHITGAQRRHENTEAWHGWATTETRNLNVWARFIVREHAAHGGKPKRGRLFVARKEVTDAELLAWLLAARREYRKQEAGR